MSGISTEIISTPFGFTGGALAASRYGGGDFDSFRKEAMALHLESVRGWLNHVNVGVVSIQTCCLANVQAPDYDGRKDTWQTVVSYQDAA